MNARQEAQTLLAELETAHQQLAEYAQKVETLTLETERQRMARELHDTLAQGLAGLVLQIEGLEAHLEQENIEKVAEIAAQAKSRARTTLAEARQAIGDLRQQSVATPAEAIVREVERFRRATGIPCDLTLPEMLTLSDQLGDHVVRCVSEGLTNVMHMHGQRPFPLNWGWVTAVYNLPSTTTARASTRKNPCRPLWPRWPARTGQTGRWLCNRQPTKSGYNLEV